MGRKLYVGNLPFTAGEAELQELFSTAGAVDSVKVMRDMATGRARGFAFVEMSSDDDAQKAIDKLHNADFGGRNLTVNEARPRPERSGAAGSRASTRSTEPYNTARISAELKQLPTCEARDR